MTEQRPQRTPHWLLRTGRGFRTFRTRVRQNPVGRYVWRGLITVVGVLVIVIGIVLLPLPGPGWVVIFAGLGLLATEYDWARRLLAWARTKAADLASKTKQRVTGRRNRS
jgi:uncharacterized protein (TIGR02611 family)